MMEYKAHEIVIGYIREHTGEAPRFEVFTVWKCKALRNWKFLVSSSLPDGMYYELTYDGGKARWYLDAYKKFESRIIEI